MNKFFLGFLLLFSSIIWAADDFAPEDDNSEVYSNDFILNTNDEAGDITIQFGSSLAEYLKWNDTFSRFDLSDGLRIQGNFETEGNTLTLDADNAGVGANVDIIANQGSDSQGALRYNATTNQWEIKNNGGVFSPIRTADNTILQFSENIDPGEEVFVIHASDVNYKRIIEVFFSNISSMLSGVWNILDSEEVSYIQENSSITEFLSNTIHLTPSGAFSVGSTNLALAATAFSSDESRDPALANDGQNNTFWYNQAGGPSAGQWWAVDLGEEMRVMRAQINWFSSVYHATTMEIQGSHDRATWTTVDTVNPSGTGNETFDFSPATYRYWRFYCVTGANSTYFVLDEGRFFEAEGSGYSTTPAYVTTGSAKSIGTTSWQSIDSVNMFGGEPTNTELKFLFSFDGRSTWKAFSGGSWVVRTLTDIENTGMTRAETEALTSTNWNSSGGLNSDPLEKLDFAVSLETTDTDETPSFSGIQMTYQTASLWQHIQEEITARLRYISPTVTSITNLMNDAKDFKINVILPTD